MDLLVKINEGLKELIQNELWTTTSLEDMKKKAIDYLATQNELEHFFVKCDEENNIYIEDGIKLMDVYVTLNKQVYVNQITLLKTDEII